MYCEHLSLVNFRNFARLELDLPTGLTIVLGDNAQGKSNLLEAIYVMATTKSFRASSDRELINWQAAEESLPFARIAARLRRDHRSLRLELVVKEESRPANGIDGAPSVGTVKRIRLNDVPRRALDIIGEVNVVMFSPQDIDLVQGPPLLRRRYMDVTISQVDPQYCRFLAHYNRVLLQRNHLLRQIRERQAWTDQLEFWDREMVEAGSYIILQRLETVDSINLLARDLHRHLTQNREALRVCYRPSLDTGDGSLNGGRLADTLVTCQSQESRLAAISRAYGRRISEFQAKEIAYGASLFGPHRDDLLFSVNEREVATLGSRGQQRTVALSLKLAEADFMRGKTGSYPIVLLDDVMSELDRTRRRQVLELTAASDQVLVTATDQYVFEPETLARANLLSVEQGVVEAASIHPAAS